MVAIREHGVVDKCQAPTIRRAQGAPSVMVQAYRPPSHLRRNLGHARFHKTEPYACFGGPGADKLKHVYLTT